MDHLTVYGDSIAAGYGAPPGRGFVPDLASILSARTGTASPYLNFGVPGMTSYALASALVYNDAWCSGLIGSNSVCVLIGGDDLIANLSRLLRGNRQAIAQTAKASAHAYAVTLARIRTRVHAPLAVGTLYNPYPATPLAQEAVTAYNEGVIIPAATTAGAAIAPIHEAFAGQQAALIEGYSTGVAGQPGRAGVAFPIHPNARGHAVIAQAFAALLR